MPSSTNLDRNPEASPPPTPAEEEDGMHTSTTSSSALVRGRPKTVYFHGGIGGAGNYRKVIKDSPAAHPHTEHRRSPISRGLQSFFGSSGGTNAAPTAGANSSHPGPEGQTTASEEELARIKLGQRTSPSRGFLGIGGLGNRRQRQHSPSSDVTSSTNGDSGYASQYSNQAAPLGAAEALRRKMLGDKSRGQSNR